MALIRAPSGARAGAVADCMSTQGGLGQGG